MNKRVHLCFGTQLFYDLRPVVVNSDYREIGQEKTP